MFAVKVVLVVIVAPHAGLAKTGGKEKKSVEPRTVSRRMLRIDIGLFFKENHQKGDVAVDMLALGPAKPNTLPEPVSLV